MWELQTEDLFYDMQKQLYEEWSGQFECDTDNKFTACKKDHLGINYHTPPIVSDNSTIGIICLSILEKCLDAENEYKNTFWLECMRVCLKREFIFEIDKSEENVFDSFIGFMLSFNSTYPLTLPSIFHSTMEMHKAARFFMPRTDKNETFFLHVLTTEILLRYELSHVVEDEDESGDSSSTLEPHEI